MNLRKDHYRLYYANGVSPEPVRQRRCSLACIYRILWFCVFFLEAWWRGAYECTKHRSPLWPHRSFFSGYLPSSGPTVAAERFVRSPGPRFKEWPARHRCAHFTHARGGNTTGTRSRCPSPRRRGGRFLQPLTGDRPAGSFAPSTNDHNHRVCGYPTHVDLSSSALASGCVSRALPPRGLKSRPCPPPAAARRPHLVSLLPKKTF